MRQCGGAVVSRNGEKHEQERYSILASHAHTSLSAVDLLLNTKYHDNTMIRIRRHLYPAPTEIWPSLSGGCLLFPLPITRVSAVRQTKSG